MVYRLALFENVWSETTKEMVDYSVYSKSQLKLTFLRRTRLQTKMSNRLEIKLLKNNNK